MTKIELKASDLVVLSINYYSYLTNNILPAKKTLMDLVNHREAKIHHSFRFSSLWMKKVTERERERERCC